MIKYEYMNVKIVSPGVDSVSHDLRMNSLGDEGWELVQVEYGVDNNGTPYCRVFFKRPKD